MYCTSLRPTRCFVTYYCTYCARVDGGISKYLRASLRIVSSDWMFLPIFGTLPYRPIPIARKGDLSSKSIFAIGDDGHAAKYIPLLAVLCPGLRGLFLFLLIPSFFRLFCLLIIFDHPSRHWRSSHSHTDRRALSHA